MNCGNVQNDKMTFNVQKVLLLLFLKQVNVAICALFVCKFMNPQIQSAYLMQSISCMPLEFLSIKREKNYVAK